MIANELQHQQTRRKLAEIEQLVAGTEAGTAGDEGFRDLQIAALSSQIDDLRGELAEYSQLRSQ